MAETRVDVTDVKWTALVTLYLRALDARSPAPVLGDHAAATALDRIDDDFDGFRMRATAGDRWMVVLRARTLDAWAAEFLVRHPGATVLHLGCGLDSRAFRLERPAGTRWFDVDQPEILALRERVYTPDEGYRAIAASVTDPGWLAEIPTDAPVLIIAEGLLMYLAPAEVATLLQRLRARFATGELIFDGISPWAVWTAHHGGRLWGEFSMRWGIREAADVTRMEPSYRLLAQRGIIAQGDRIPVTAYRWLYRGLRAVPGLRDTMRVFHFAF